MMTDRFKAALEAFIRRLTRRYDYAFPWMYTVAAQNGDGSLELTPDRSEMPGLSNIAPKWGDAGTKTTVKKGARCAVMFEGGDPSKPFVLGWEHGSYSMINIGDNGRPVAHQGDLVQCGGAGTVVTLSPLSPIPSYPVIATMTPMQCLISFSMIPPTLASADPLVGVVSVGSDVVMAE
jgi:hypothetical protein